MRRYRGLRPTWALAAAGMVAALLLRLTFATVKERASWPVVVIGTLLVGVGASFFLPLKYAIPSLVPFWLDGPLATAERHAFGSDPWRIADGLFGWALVPVHCVYAFERLEGDCAGCLEVRKIFLAAYRQN